MARGKRGDPDELKQARQAVRDAEAAYKSRCRTAERALEDAERAHARRVRDTEKALDLAQQQCQADVDRAHWAAEFARSGAVEDSYGEVRLYPDRLETPQGAVALSPAVRATVEATGIQTEKSDTRETLLLLDTPAFDAVIRVNPSDTTRVREFAARINTAAKNAEARKREHAAALAAAEGELSRVRADRTAIERAEAELARAQADTEPTRLASAALERARAATDELDAARARLLELDPEANVRPLEELQRSSRASGVSRAWRNRSRKARAGIVAAAVLLALLAVGALAGDPPENTVAREDATVSAPQPVELALETPTDELLSVTKATQELRGRVTPGASVTINGTAVPVSAGAFETSVPLEIGENELLITATKAGLEGATASLSITRELPKLTLRLERPRAEAITVRAPQLEIAGVASRGSTLRLNNRPLELRGIRFTSTLALKHGRNTFLLGARKKGHQPEQIELTVIRRLSAAEIAARQAQVRERFIAQARTIPYNQLIKNPEAYAGTKVRYYGEILQIQDAGGSGIMLLYVTDLGYDVWTDQIWVNYNGRVRGAEGDKLTVYGNVVGTRSYETQAGGETYVPEIDAKYIVE
jgi:hypothetical protein